MSRKTWLHIATGLVAGVFVLALIPDADAQRGGRGGGARAGAGGGGGGGFSRGGAASGGGFAAGGQRGGGAQASQGARGDRGQQMQDRQGQRQDAAAGRQSSRQDAAASRQSSRQDAANDYYGSSGCHDCWDGAAVAAGIAAGAIVAGAAATAAAQPAPTTYVNQAPQQTPPPCNVAPATINGVPYYKCGATWYTAGYGNAGVVYMPVPPPQGN